MHQGRHKHSLSKDTCLQCACAKRSEVKDEFRHGGRLEKSCKHSSEAFQQFQPQPDISLSKRVTQKIINRYCLWWYREEMYPSWYHNENAVRSKKSSATKPKTQSLSHRQKRLVTVGRGGGGGGGRWCVAQRVCKVNIAQPNYSDRTVIFSTFNHNGFVHFERWINITIYS